jgi:hypothetical protein
VLRPCPKLFPTEETARAGANSSVRIMKSPEVEKQVLEDNLKELLSRMLVQCT